MDTQLFVNSTSGDLVTISGTDPLVGAWTHMAFVPRQLPDEEPELSRTTSRAVADARAALAALDSTARQLPNPTLLRAPTLRREAQATSALEGTYAPLRDVLTADEESSTSVEMREVLNYVDAANAGFRWRAEGRPISTTMLTGMQGILMRGTAGEEGSGELRSRQVVIGRRADAPRDAAPIHASRFVPAPPGDMLRSGVDDLIRWIRSDRSDRFDPVVSAAMAHHQLETLHPFADGNGRIGRLVIVLHLLQLGVLSEPTLTVSPWFEARRNEYYDALLEVSASGSWDHYVGFFARGIEGAAALTLEQMLSLVRVQAELKELIRASKLRADTAHALVDHAVANPSFTVRSVERSLGISYGRANSAVNQLIQLGILVPLGDRSYNRRFVAPRVLEVLLRDHPR